MAEHRACRGCLEGCTATDPKHCTSCVHEPWPCDAARLTEEIEFLLAEAQEPKATSAATDDRDELAEMVQLLQQSRTPQEAPE